MRGMNRRDFLKLSAGLSAAVAAPGLMSCATERTGRPADRNAQLAPLSAKLDYKKARAVPTICFGCTTHCGVIGWVQDDRVRLIEGNPLDPNSQGTICSKANPLPCRLSS